MLDPQLDLQNVSHFDFDFNLPCLLTTDHMSGPFFSNSVYQVDSIETTITTDACKGTVNEVNFIEQVEIVVTIQAPVRGQLEIYLTSPMGTKSLILPKRPKDVSADGFKRWSFMSVQLWGELPRGDWKLMVKSNQINNIRSVGKHAVAMATNEPSPRQTGSR